MIFFIYSGKRRYDRKQSGFGGQTKVIFRKKVGIISLLKITIVPDVVKLCTNQEKGSEASYKLKMFKSGFLK